MGTVQEAEISRVREAERLDRLQAELEGQVAKDSRYWIQNDAKFRAVAQVRDISQLLQLNHHFFLQGASYEQFEELVATSHLTPLAREDIVGGLGKQGLWNPVAQVQAQVEEGEQENKFAVMDWKKKELTNVKEFREVWINGSNEDQVELLNKLGEEGLLRLFSTDIPVDIFQKIVSLFLDLDGYEDLIMKTLLTLSRASRFSLCLLFMEPKDKANVKVLIEKLEKKGVDKVDQLKKIYL